MKRKSKTKAMPGIRTSPIVLRQLKEIDTYLEELGARVLRLELGHSGDPAAHAALAPNVEQQQPASEAAPVTDAPAEQGT